MRQSTAAACWRHKALPARRAGRLGALAGPTPCEWMRARLHMALPHGTMPSPCRGAAVPGRHRALRFTSAPLPAGLMRAAA